MKVFKYPLNLVDLQILKLPASATILCVKEQHGELFLWALVDPGAAPEGRQIRIAGTGHHVDANIGAPIFIDTVVMSDGMFVWHVFEITE